MPTLDEIRSQIENLRQEEARRAANIDQLTAHRAEVLDRLQNEFGITSIEDGQKVLAELKQTLDDNIAALAAALKEQT